MTSYRRIDANRRTTLRRERCLPSSVIGPVLFRALRHGLTAKTIIGALEDAEDYKAFEAAITRDYERHLQ
jgi:hypothetical protein